MQVQPESVGDVFHTTAACRDFLEREGIARGHRFKCCGCPVCTAYRLLQEAVQELTKGDCK